MEQNFKQVMKLLLIQEAVLYLMIITIMSIVFIIFMENQEGFYVIPSKLYQAIKEQIN